MNKKDPQIQSSISPDKLPEQSAPLEQEQLDPNTAQPPTGTIKQAITKEIKELIKSYVEYAKDVDL